MFSMQIRWNWNINCKLNHTNEASSVCVCLCESKVNILIKSNSTMAIIYKLSKINQLIPLAKGSKSTSFVVWYHTLWNTICEHAPHCTLHSITNFWFIIFNQNANFMAPSLFLCTLQIPTYSLHTQTYMLCHNCAIQEKKS